MIVRLCEDTPKLGLRIVQPGCGGKQLMDTAIHLAVTPAGCDARDILESYWEDCRLKWRSKKEELPSVTYPAFEADGEYVIFYFDDKLWSMPPGRYRGQVMINGVALAAPFDIDLCSRPIVIEAAMVISATPCEGC